MTIQHRTGHDLTDYAESVQPQENPLHDAWTFMLSAPPTIGVCRGVNHDILDDIAIAMF